VSEFNSNPFCYCFPTVSPVGNDRANRQASINKQSVELPECVSSTVHVSSAKAQQPSYLRQWLGTADAMSIADILPPARTESDRFHCGVINLLTLHSIAGK